MGGVVRERMVAIAVCGNIVTAWSWFGTNLLGVGLHSYGFTDKGFKWLAIFFLSQLVFILLANLPWSYWLARFRNHPTITKKIKSGLTIQARGWACLCASFNLFIETCV